MYDEEVARLQATPMLRHLDRRQLKLLILSGMRVCYPAGEAVIRQGERADAVFVVLEGEAAAERGSATFPVIPFHAGEVFGEVAVFLDEPYHLTIKALEPLVLLRIEGDAFVELVRQIPDLAVAVIRDLSCRLSRLRERVEHPAVSPEASP